MRKLHITMVCGVAVSLMAAPAAAHHSFVMFDLTKEIVLEGVVTKFDVKNPHTYLAIRVSQADGTEHEHEIEAGPSSIMRPVGLTRDSVRVGDAVTLRAHPPKRGRVMLGRELVKSDGTVLPLVLPAAERRFAASEAAAQSLAGTWVPQGFFEFLDARLRWPLTEQGRAAFERYDPLQSMQGECIPVTAPQLMSYPVVNQIELADDVVRIRVDWMTSDRHVYLDGRGHPSNGERTLHGHSIGAWEGETLVIDTTLFADHAEGNALGIPSGPRKHLVERLTLSENRRQLRYEAVLEDPDWLAAPVTHSAVWDYRPELVSSGLECDIEIARRSMTNN